MSMIGKGYLENVVLSTVKKVSATKESYEIVCSHFYVYLTFF
jgi:hypothetical protein